MNHLPQTMNPEMVNHFTDDQLTVIGFYGPWAASLTANKLPSFSFRNPEWTDLESWRPKARQQVMNRMAIPDIGPAPVYPCRPGIGATTVYQSKNWNGNCLMAAPQEPCC